MARFILVAPLLMTMAAAVWAAAPEIPRLSAEALVGSDRPAARGQLRPRRHALLAAGIAGRLAEVAVRAGSRVEKGEALVTFDCRAEEAERAVVATKVEAAGVKHDVNRRLAEMQNISKLEVALSQAELRIARAELRRLDAMLDKCRVKAPFAGAVVEKLVQAHQFVAVGEPLLRLVDPAELEIEAVLPSGWLRWLKPGVAFRLRVDETGDLIDARIERVIDEVDPVSQTVRVVGVPLAAPSALLPGMSGELLFEGR